MRTSRQTVLAAPVGRQSREERLLRPGPQAREVRLSTIPARRGHKCNQQTEWSGRFSGRKVKTMTLFDFMLNVDLLFLTGQNVGNVGKAFPFFSYLQLKSTQG